MKKTFENWLWEEVESCFDIQRTTTNPILTEWENTGIVLDKTWENTLKRLQNLLENHYQDWNEEELKLNFIAPLLSLINYYENNFSYQPFAERVIKAEINDWEISGTIDWLLASGKQTPQKPFFFLHEYKRTKMGDSDPLGQLLIAMLTAQKNNKDPKPVFGAYIIGKDWYFVVLHKNTYTQTKPLEAIEKADLEQITKMLCEVKNLAAKYVY